LLSATQQSSCLLPFSNATIYTASSFTCYATKCLLLIISKATINQFAPGFINHATTLCPPAPFSFYHPLTLLTARVC
jgi:hypothetical protein